MMWKRVFGGKGKKLRGWKVRKIKTTEQIREGDAVFWGERMQWTGLKGGETCKIAFGEGLEMHGKHPSGVIAVHVKRPGESVLGLEEGGRRRQKTADGRF